MGFDFTIKKVEQLKTWFILTSQKSAKAIVPGMNIVDGNWSEIVNIVKKLLTLSKTDNLLNDLYLLFSVLPSFKSLWMQRSYKEWEECIRRANHVQAVLLLRNDTLFLQQPFWQRLAGQMQACQVVPLRLNSLLLCMLAHKRHLGWHSSVARVAV